MSRFLETDKITLSLTNNKVANFGIRIRPDRDFILILPKSSTYN